MAEFSNNSNSDPEARALANQALQLFQSHERLDEERWENNTKRFDEAGRSIQRQFDEVNRSITSMRADISGALTTITIKLEGIDKLYSTRWWQLAVSLVTILLGISGFLAVKTLFK